jgi:gluconolactonase
VREAEIATFASFLEGPVATTAGAVYFCDVRANRILRLAPGGDLEVFREDAGRAIGNAWDLDGNLVTCEGAEHGTDGRRRLTRTVLATGAVEVLADRYNGHRLNSPNDVTCDEHGRLFFTDPRYGPRTDMDMPDEAVYRLDPDGTLMRIVSQPIIERPNGLAITPDCTELYVVDSNHSVGGNRKVWGFTLDSGGTVTSQRLIYDFSPGRGGDGLEIDTDGNLYICAGIMRPRSAGETTLVPPGVYIISPGGRMIDVIDIRQDVITNCCFGGPDLRTLFVTAGHLLFSTRVGAPGYHAGLRPSPQVGH